MRWKFLFTFLFFGLVTGCVNREYIEVSALTASDAPTTLRKYQLVADNYQPKNNDLQFAEYARQVNALLAQQGYVQVNNLSDAELLISLSYRVDAPRTQTHVVNTPVYPPYGPYYGRPFGYYPYHYPMLGFPVYEQMVYQTVTYNKLVRLQAIDAAQYGNDKTVKPLWDILLVSNNENGDLRYMFPYMLTAAKPYIGRNSERRIEVAVEKEDPQVIQLRLLNSKSHHSLK